MQKANENTLLFVPLVGKTSACRQKEGLKLIKNLPRLTAVLPQSGKDAMKSPSFGTTCHFPHKGGRSTGSTRYLTQGRENNGCFASSQNVGQTLPDNRKNLIENNSCVVGPEQQLLRTSALFNCQVQPDLHINYKGSPSPLVGEGARRAGEGFPRAFTLIELLVVVLIIGILAAIAVPQYHKVVMKSRLTQALLFQRNAMQALDRWVLENGTPTQPLAFLGPNANASLDIDLTNGMTCIGTTCTDKNNWKYSVGIETEDTDTPPYLFIHTTFGSLNEDDIIYFKYPDGRIKEKSCYCMSGNDNAVKLCEMLHSLDNNYQVGY